MIRELSLHSFYYTEKKTNIDKVNCYLRNDLTGSESGGLVGGSGSHKEKVKEMIKELVRNGSIGRVSGCSKRGGERNDAVRGGEAPLEME